MAFRIHDCPVGDDSRLPCGLTVPFAVLQDLKLSAAAKVLPALHASTDWLDQHAKMHEATGEGGSKPQSKDSSIEAPEL